MDLIWTASGQYHRASYGTEAELEAAILDVKDILFGKQRIYLDVKKKIGGKNGPNNIPDGYLIDLVGSRPKLYVVENELAAHDPLRHIAVQILQFSLSFESEPRLVKTVLHNALQNQPEAFKQCEHYATSHNFRNLDHMLEFLVFESSFAALVIIDEMPENLENVLLTRFKFAVEVLELARYENAQHVSFYRFEPFLYDLAGPSSEAKATEGEPILFVPPDVIDTVVVPAREEGFREVFLGENRWYAVRIHGAMRPQIKYIAAYQVAPISAITHLAPVSSIEPWKDTDKAVVNFAESAHKIEPISMLKVGHIRTFQNLRYTNYARLINAKSLDDIWGTN
jgi:hypothetical protein